MIVDALQRLAAAGFPISDYQYTGFGAIYFVDFTLFHKLLGMEKLLSLEKFSSLKRRVDFNRPFSCVDTKMVPASSAIPSLSRDAQHIVWLDYDGVIHKDFLSDIQSAVTVLSPGSILLVTVEVEAPDESDYREVAGDFDNSNQRLGTKQWKAYFEFHAATYLRLGLSEEDFGLSELPKRTTEVLKVAFNRPILTRPGLDFLPMFNFLYRDTHRMLTMGGMIASSAEKRRVRGSDLSNTNYYRDSFDSQPCEITVPRLTRKERIYLDREMPCAVGWTPTDFDLDPDDVRRYREIYRFLPAFAEILP